MLAASRQVFLLLVLALLARPALAHESTAAHLDRLQRELASSPTRADLHLERVGLLRRARRLAEASAALDEAASAGAKSPGLELERALVATALETDEVALAAFARCEAAGLRTAESEEERARLLLRQGDPAGAETALERATHLGPTPDRFLGLGRLQAHRGAPERARATWRRGLSTLGPSEVLGRLLVQSLQEDGLHLEALSVIDLELEVRPERPEWLLLRQESLAELGREDEAHAAARLALRLAERAARRRPSRAHHLTLARARRAAGDRRGAHRALEAALRLAPSDPELLALREAWGASRGIGE